MNVGQAFIAPGSLNARWGINRRSMAGSKLPFLRQSPSASHKTVKHDVTAKTDQRESLAISAPKALPDRAWECDASTLLDVSSNDCERHLQPSPLRRFWTYDVTHESDVISDVGPVLSDYGSQALKLKVQKLCGLGPAATSANTTSCIAVGTRRTPEAGSTHHPPSGFSTYEEDAYELSDARSSIYSIDDVELGEMETITAVGPEREIAAFFIYHTPAVPPVPPIPQISARDSSLRQNIENDPRTIRMTAFGPSSSVVMRYSSLYETSQRFGRRVKMGGEYFPAATKVVNNQKLFEMILAQLPTKDLLRFQQTSKAFRQTMTQSRQFREKLHLAPASLSKPDTRRLNPLTTSIGDISIHHPVHNLINVEECLRPDRKLILSHKGRYYKPEKFFSYASNPSLYHDVDGFPFLQWELRELSQTEASEQAQHVVFVDEISSVWSMNLCQPPPVEVHVTVWKKESTKCIVSEKIIVRAWVVREIFNKMHEARHGIIDEYLSSPSLESNKAPQVARKLKPVHDFVIRPKHKRSLMRLVKDYFTSSGSSPSTTNLGALMMGMGSHQMRPWETKRGGEADWSR